MKKFLLFVMLCLMSNGFTMVDPVDMDMWDELGSLPEYRYRQDDLKAFENPGDDTDNPYIEMLREIQLKQAQAPQEYQQREPEQFKPLIQESVSPNVAQTTKPLPNIGQAAPVALVGQVHDAVAAGVVHGALTSRLVSPTPEQQVEPKEPVPVAQIAQEQGVVVAAVATDQPVTHGVSANRTADSVPSFRLIQGKGLKFVIKPEKSQGGKNVLPSVATHEQGTRSKKSKPKSKPDAQQPSKSGRKKSVSPQTWMKQFEREEPENPSLSWLNSSLKKLVLLILEDLKNDGKSTRYAVVQNVIAKGADPAVAWEILEDERILMSYVKAMRKNFGRKASYKEKVFKRVLYFSINLGLLDRNDQDATKTFGSCGNDECLLPQYVLILSAPGNSHKFKTSREEAALQIPNLIKKCGGVTKHSMNNKPLMDALCDAISSDRYRELKYTLGMGGSPRKRSRKKSYRSKSQEIVTDVVQEKAQETEVKVKKEEAEEELDLYCYETFDLDEILRKKA